jgi:hypothetical protein
MIRFNNIKWRNFLSTGNQFTEIQLNKNPTTLIVGENGAGKCVDPSTKIEIQISDPEIRRKFEEFFP